ncbi:MAG: hypothetical protein WC890_04400 [Candidatus Margulisiibacteriota bacterium]
MHKVVLFGVIVIFGISASFALTDRSTYSQNFGERIKIDKYVDGIAVNTLEIKKDGVGGRMEIRYPQVANLKDRPVEEKINQKIREAVLDRTTNFEKKISCSASSEEYEITSSFGLQGLRAEYLSFLILFKQSSSGGERFEYFPLTLNFDLKSGEVLTLSDLFLPGTKYLKAISDLSKKVFPRADQFNQFYLTNYSIVILFTDNIMGSNSLGFKEVSLYFWDIPASLGFPYKEHLPKI